MNKRQQQGFTLVEIAIVLVIIGLLLGGVLKGQEMIANARYKNLRDDIQSYSAAYYTFQDRYRALAGDFDQASTRIDASAPDGNGNGNIQGARCNNATDESCYVWQQLRYAGLISGDPGASGGNANPSHAYGGELAGIYSGSNGNRTGVWLRMRTVPADVARRLDDIDDGDARNGTVYCASGSCSGGSSPATGNLRIYVLI